MIRVLIIDDKEMVRQKIVQLLLETDDISVSGEATSGHDGLDMLSKIPCDVALLDIAMPYLDGFETLKLLREKYPDLPVIMLSIFPEDQYATRAMKAGATGCIAKSNASAKLNSAVRKAARENR